MKPIFFTIPGINWDIPGYGLMLMLGLFISIWWAARRAAKSGGNPDVILNCGFIAIIAGVVGCRVMYVAHYWDSFRLAGSPLQIAWAVINVSKGGLEFYGGFILTVVCVLAWLRWKEKTSLRWYLDILAPSAALGLAIGRIGCLLNGCCFGVECKLPWAVEFPYGSNASIHQWREGGADAGLREELLYTDAATGVTMMLPRESFYVSDERLDSLARIDGELTSCLAGVRASKDADEKRRLSGRIAQLNAQVGRNAGTYLPVYRNMQKYGLSAAEIRAVADAQHARPVHPTQIYSTITALLIALFLSAVYWRRTRDGQVICTLLLIEPLSRWMLEVIRADNPIDTVGVFTISQFLAIGLTVLGLIGLFALRLLPPRSPRAALWEPPEEESSGGNRKQRPAAKAG